MKFRTIYIIYALGDGGEVVALRFARNKKIAKKIARQCRSAYVFIREASSNERLWIDLEDVEG